MGENTEKQPATKVGRLAMRHEGDWWVAYYAMPDTMADAIELGRVKMRIVADRRDRMTAFMNFMREGVGDIVEQAVGTRPTWPEGPQPAPKSERAGHG